MTVNVLLDQQVAYVRSLFTEQAVPTVQEYAGEFNAEEVARLSFSCPAVLLSVLGWTDARESKRMGGRRNARLHKCVAFVVTNDVDRIERMKAATAIADSLAYGLNAWTPQDQASCAIAAIEDEPQAENMFGRAIDQKGLALWMLVWEQAAMPLRSPAAMFDLTRVSIESTARHAVDVAPQEAPPLTVEHKLDLT